MQGEHPLNGNLKFSLLLYPDIPLFFVCGKVLINLNFKRLIHICYPVKEESVVVFGTNHVKGVVVFYSH